MSRLISYGVFAGSRFKGGDKETAPAGLPGAPWYISSAKLEPSNSVVPTLTEIGGSCLNPDGTELYTVGLNNGTATISQITFETGYDFGSRVGEKTLDVSAQDTLVADVSIKNDGTKLYFVGGSTGNRMYQYTLSTPYDISTASYDSISTTTFVGDRVFWSNTGSNFFSVDRTTVYSYSVSTAWSLADISGSGQSTFSLKGCIGGTDIIRSVSFKPDGTKMFVATNTDTELEEVVAGNYIYQFELSTPWEVSSATYEGQYSDTADSGLIQDIFINPNTGTDIALTLPTEVVYLGITLDANYDDLVTFTEFTEDGVTEENNLILLSPTASQGFEESDWSSFFPSFDCLPAAYKFNAKTSTSTELLGTANDIPVAGTPVIAKEGCSSKIVRGTLGNVDSEVVFIPNTPASINNTSYDNVSLSLSSTVSSFSPSGIAFNPDGTKMFTVGYSNDSVYQFSLSTEFDLSTAVYDGVSLDVRSQESTPYGITFGDDGLLMFIVGSSTDSVHLYNLGTAYDLSTATYANVSFNVAAQHYSPEDIRFSNDGLKMFIVGSGTDRLSEYELTEPWNITTANYTGVQLSGIGSAPNGFAFNNNGERVYVTGSSSDSVFEFTLTTAFDLSTASSTGSFSVRSQDGSPEGLTFSTDGTKMYMVGRFSYSVYQYSIDGTVNGDEFKTQWSVDISSLGLSEAPTILVNDTIPQMSTIFLPSRDDLPGTDSAILHTEVTAQYWVDDYIKTLYRKVVRPGNRIIQSRFITDPSTTVLGSRYDLTKAPPGTRDTTGLTPPFITEDFEDDTFEFEFTGDWARTTASSYEGSFSFGSTNQNVQGSVSASNAILPLDAPSKITFWYRVSSESNYDFLNIYINGTRVVRESGGGVWTFYESGVYPAGTVDFRVEYTKDGSVNGNDDTGYIDNLTVDARV